MTDFTDFSELDLEEGEAPLLDEDFDAPPPGSVEAAAIKIDAILEAGDYERREDIDSEVPDQERDPFGSGLAVSEADMDALFAIEIDGEETEVPLSELAAAFQKTGETEMAGEGLKARMGEVDTAFEAASNQIEALIPALRHQVYGELANMRTPGDIELLARSNPARFAEVQARAHALQQAEGYAATLSEFHRSRTLDAESEELSRLIPELEDKEGGDALREEIRAYGKAQGFDDKRFADAGAAEIAILHKAMKYDRLEQGHTKAKRRARTSARARPVMTPGHARRQDPQADYRKAMAKLKKTGHVEDAARVIDLIL